MSLVKRINFPVIREAQFYSRILMLGVPIILQQFLRVSVDTADSIMLGRIDQVQMSAVSQAQQIFFILYAMAFQPDAAYWLLNIGGARARKR